MYNQVCVIMYMMYMIIIHIDITNIHIYIYIYMYIYIYIYITKYVISSCYRTMPTAAMKKYEKQRKYCTRQRVITT